MKKHIGPHFTFLPSQLKKSFTFEVTPMRFHVTDTRKFQSFEDLEINGKSTSYSLVSKRKVLVNHNLYNPES